MGPRSRVISQDRSGWGPWPPLGRRDDCADCAGTGWFAARIRYIVRSAPDTGSSSVATTWPDRSTKRGLASTSRTCARSDAHRARAGVGRGCQRASAVEGSPWHPQRSARRRHAAACEPLDGSSPSRCGRRSRAASSRAIELAPSREGVALRFRPRLLGVKSTPHAAPCAIPSDGSCQPLAAACPPRRAACSPLPPPESSSRYCAVNLRLRHPLGSGPGDDAPRPPVPERPSLATSIAHCVGLSDRPTVIPRGIAGVSVTERAGHLKAVKQLALIANDDIIAGILNRNGLLTGNGNRWNRERVCALRSHRRIPVYRPASDGIEPWLNLTRSSAFSTLHPKRSDWRPLRARSKRRLPMARGSSNAPFLSDRMRKTWRNEAENDKRSAKPIYFNSIDSGCCETGL